MIRLLKIDGQTPDRKIYTLFSDTKTEIPQTGAATMSSPTLTPGSMVYTANGEVAFLKSDDTWNWAEGSASTGGGGSGSNVVQPSFSGYMITRKGNGNGYNGLLAGSWVETWDMISTGNRDFSNTNYNSPSKIYFKNGITTLTERTCTNCKNLNYVYLANTITSIDPLCFGFSSNTSEDDNLTLIEVESGFNVDLWLAAQGGAVIGGTLALSGLKSLTRECIRGIIDNYADNSGKTLTLTSECYLRLTREDFSVATAKGLSIASYDFGA